MILSTMASLVIQVTLVHCDIPGNKSTGEVAKAAEGNLLQLHFV